MPICIRACVHVLCLLWCYAVFIGLRVYSPLTIYNTRIENNKADVFGGGIAFYVCIMACFVGICVCVRAHIALYHRQEVKAPKLLIPTLLATQPLLAEVCPLQLHPTPPPL